MECMWSCVSCGVYTVYRVSDVLLCVKLKETHVGVYTVYMVSGVLSVCVQVLCSNSLLDSSEYWLSNNKVLCRVSLLEEDSEGSCTTVSRLTVCLHAKACLSVRRSEPGCLSAGLRLVLAALWGLAAP